MFSERDIDQMALHGVNPDVAASQVRLFQTGFPPLALDRPARAGDGIMILEEEQKRRLANLFEARSGALRMLKFVPASGAATRMFKDLFTWKEKLSEGMDPGELTASDGSAAEFFSRLADFAFWDELVLRMCREDLDATHLLSDRNFLPVLDFVLNDHGLGYAFMPKGLILFHAYPDHCRTAMEEHLVEGTAYGRNSQGNVRVHFTVSPDHIGLFQERMKQVAGQYEERFGVRFEVFYSIQKPSTDTIAVGPDNQPFRELDGSLLFRPGGHGALIENLNDLDADLVFIKNIDNIVPDHLKEQTIYFKKVLGGLLIRLQEEIHHWMRLTEHKTLSAEEYSQALDFAVNSLCIDRRHFAQDPDNGSIQLRELLNRPVRVCGMVKNEGEPGGGPFWVMDKKSGNTSLQIIETSQVDQSDSRQQDLLKQSSHFNPVDLVCALKDYRGKKFDLLRFVDPQTGFISRKSKDGKELKALELPGLWNGSMAHWISVFVEVPLITFNPVKVVNDLLRKEHQPG